MTVIIQGQRYEISTAVSFVPSRHSFSIIMTYNCIIYIINLLILSSKDKIEQIFETNQNFVVDVIHFQKKDGGAWSGAPYGKNLQDKTDATTFLYIMLL